MRRYVKPILLRIPAIRRYLDEKRAIAVALKEAKAQSDRLGGELASLRDKRVGDLQRGRERAVP